ncbi:MAG: N-acetylneuraminate synthase family protein [Gemmatimonadaceae bacterium]|nr:N-acetylneuraminate synthase family protein [Gemmatimonadaceae bacterium]
MPTLEIGGRTLGDEHPTYFIADIAANHDGDLERAVSLIHLAAECGADAAKFQHFRAENIVSRLGFETAPQLSHQRSWKRSVFEVYQAASLPWEWTGRLKTACDEVGIHFFSSPYDLDAVDMLEPHVPAYKIGSGDITWIEALEHIARKGKPVLLATGASDIGDVERAVTALLRINPLLLLMQCNTNYTGSTENFRFVNLRVLSMFRAMYPDLVLGLSDHTPGHAAVLGAVALGARAMEKHFTDDRSREGPDHPFSLDASAWREMVDRTRELEHALGDGEKIVEANERETAVIQRRCLRAARDLPPGTVLAEGDLEPLRPAPADAIFPFDRHEVIGRTLARGLERGDYPRWTDLT